MRTAIGAPWGGRDGETTGISRDTHMYHASCDQNLEWPVRSWGEDSQPPGSQMAPLHRKNSLDLPDSVVPVTPVSTGS